MRVIGRREIHLWASEVSGRRVAEPRDLADGAVVLALVESIWPGPAARQRRLLRRLGGSGNWEVVRALFQELGLPTAACNESGVRAGRFSASFTLLGMLFFLQALALTRDCTVDFAHPLEPSVARFLGSSEAVSVLVRGGALKGETPEKNARSSEPVASTLAETVRERSGSQPSVPQSSGEQQPRGPPETEVCGLAGTENGDGLLETPGAEVGAELRARAPPGGAWRPSLAGEGARCGLDSEKWSAKLLTELLGLLDKKGSRGASDWRALELVHSLAGEVAALQRRLQELEHQRDTPMGGGWVVGGGGMKVQRLQVQVKEDQSTDREKVALADTLRASRAEADALRRQLEVNRAAADQESAHLRALLADKDMLLEEQSVLSELTETLQRL